MEPAEVVGSPPVARAEPAARMYTAARMYDTAARMYDTAATASPRATNGQLNRPPADSNLNRVVTVEGYHVKRLAIQVFCSQVQCILYNDLVSVCLDWHLDVTEFQPGRHSDPPIRRSVSSPHAPSMGPGTPDGSRDPPGQGEIR